jgi:spore germination protein GerM
LKSFFYFLVVIMLCISSLGLPLDYSSFVYEPGIPREGRVVDDVSFTLDLSGASGENTLVNPRTVTLVITSDQETEVEFDDNLPLIVEVLQQDQKIATLDIAVKNNYDSQSKVIVSQDSPIEYTLDLSMTNTGLSNGEYTFAITSSNPRIKNSIKSPLNINISYSKIELGYTHAERSVPSGHKFMTTYFIDGTYNSFLVPVTTTVSTSQQTIAAMLQQLRSVPQGGWALAMSAPFGPINGVNRYNLTQSTAAISFSSSTLSPSENQRLNHLAVESLVRTLEAYPHVREVQFTVDDQRVDSILNGVSIKDAFPINRGASAYLAIENIDDKRILLIDYKDASLRGLSPQQTANSILDILKSGLTVDECLLHPTIPADVKINSTSIEGRILNVDFSSDIVQAFKDDQARQAVMMDSIILSLRSIADITSVKISVDGNSNLSLGQWDLSKPISDNLGVNPLK